MSVFDFVMHTPQLYNLKIRDLILRSIRSFFWDRNFTEVETPLLVPAVIPESYLEYFRTELMDRNRKKKTMFLTTSPEASLKKLIAAGIGNCFEITRSFRNTETDSGTHNPEFTILEWYRVGVDYRRIMEDCESLVNHILERIQSSEFKSKNLIHNSKSNLTITYLNRSIDITLPWQRMSVSAALEQYTGVAFSDMVFPVNRNNPLLAFRNDKILKIAAGKGYNVHPDNSWEEIFNQIFLNEVEPAVKKSDKPVILYDYPYPMSALSKTKEKDPRLCERFELYIGGLEIGDCFTELTDYGEQARRFHEEQKLRTKLKKSMVKQDNDFLQALKRGLPECAGIAVGIDRLVMLFSGRKCIQDVIIG